MTKDKGTMNSEQKNNQQQVNTEQSQEQQSEKKEQTQDRENQQKQDKSQQAQEEVKEETAEQQEQAKEEEKDSTGKKTKKEEKQEEKKEEQKTAEKSDKEKLADLQDKFLRLTAEYDNYRKRTLKEKMELTKSAGEDILKGLLPVMDDFERALQSIDEAMENQALKDGIHLIYDKFREFLKQQGVKNIEAQDKEFDTDKQEAISKVPAPSEEMKGKVVDVVQKGYYLNDKILRFAKVVVGE